MLYTRNNTDSYLASTGQGKMEHLHNQPAKDGTSFWRRSFH